MTKRYLSLSAVLALLVACGGSTGADGTATTLDTTATTGPAPQAVLLSYALNAGDEYRYEVSLDQHIEMSASGDATLLGDDEVPGSASVDLNGTATFTHVVSAGTEPGTFDIHITGEFADVGVTGVIDGEAVDSGEIPDFAALEPIDVTVTVDEQGNPVTADDGTDPMAGLFGGLEGLGSGAPAPGLDPGRFVGPSFPDSEVSVGDTWSDEIETPGLGEQSIVTGITSEVTGVDEVDGAEVFVIDTNATTSLIEFDLGDLFAGMFGAFLPEEATDEEKAELDGALEELSFLVTIDGTNADTITLFDAEAGLARRSETTAATNIAMDMNIPDETTGAMVGFAMDMTLDQQTTYRLLSGPSA